LGELDGLEIVEEVGGNPSLFDPLRAAGGR
jgi:hypothetical protein